MEPPHSPWKKPDEVMRLYRLKKKKLALQKRMKQPPAPTSPEPNKQDTAPLDFSRLLSEDKGKNPFAKSKNPEAKRQKLDYAPLDESNDKTLFALLNLPATVPEKPPQEAYTAQLSTFSNLLQKYTAEHSVQPVTEKQSKHLPVDWALKSRLRLMSPKPFAWTPTLKASEEASGITGFVRCLDTTTSSTLDTSPRARFHQTCLYWQYPHLPWLELFPRSTGKVSATSFMATNEEIKQALHKDWMTSFRCLFQMLRALHCPYFYLCANTFTCLFRAAGVCGVSQPCALITPTTRGFRQMLQQEDIEFTMPLRPGRKRLNTSDEEKAKNTSTDSCYNTMDEASSVTKTVKDEAESGDEEDHDAFLSKLGLETEVLKKINNTQARIVHSAESSVDSAAESLVFVRGADTQALFNCLLNCKSIIGTTGPLAGVPPTLLSPTAFHGGTLQSLKVRKSIIQADDTKYFSLEIRGPILPTTIHSLFDVVKNSDAQFSATFAHHKPTVAFSLAAANIAQDETSKENEPNHFTKAFNKENLSDCGISESMLQHFCSADPSIVTPLDSIKYNDEDDTYSW